MSEYKFRYQKDSDDICLIETENNIIPIIREYRGKGYCEGFSYGYNDKNPTNKDKDHYSPNSYNDNDLHFYAYIDGDLIEPHNNKQANYKYMDGDIRRVLGDILYMLYCYNGENSQSRNGSISSITYMGEKYTDIHDVQLTPEKKVIFEAMQNGNNVKICLPISIEGCENRLSPQSTQKLYCLYDQNTNLYLHDVKTVYNEHNEKFEIDRFWGTHNGYKGIFYYFHDEIIPQYAVKKEAKGQYDYTSTNIKASFHSDELFEWTDDEEDNQRIEDAFFDDFWGASFEKKVFEKFEKDFIDITWNTFFYTRERDFFCDNNPTFSGKKKEGTGNIYEFDFGFIEGNKIKYEAKDSKIEVTFSDFWSDIIELGTIHLGDNFFIRLGSEQDEFIFGNKKFQVNEKILEAALSGRLIEFPECPKSCTDTNYNCRTFPLSQIRDYIKEQSQKIIGLKESLDELCQAGKEDYLIEHSLSNNSSDLMAISQILYPAPNVADKEIVAKVYELKCLYKETGKLPNLAILGGPGTGKSTLVNRIAKCLLDNDRDDNILYKSTSDLKAPYVGQTGGKMFDLLQKAAENEKIIFIDEAYNLQKDDFGKEALEICLPLLTGDRKEIEATKDGKVITYNFAEKGKKIPAIWFAGYEHEMRKMLSENPGLYRRMHKITLSTPTVDGLYACLLEKCHDGDKDLESVFKKSRDEIRNYFGWATAKEHVSYFANYAGVDDFFMTCKIRLHDENNETVKKNIINEIIDEKKKEIKKQYKAILTDIEKIEFEVQNDIDTVLDDVKGNQNVVNNLKGIVTMMLNQEDYRRKGIHLPKGALLIGPPGTGKTMLARAVAGELQKQYNEKDKKDIRVAFIPTIATELGSPKKISALFNEAAEYDTSVIFIDEIDAIGKHRNMQGAFPTLLIQLMKEMDGFEARKNVFVMAATNDPASLDPALKRPGRFDRTIEVSYPDKNGRIAILSSALRKLWIFKGNEQAAGKLAEDLAEKTIQYAPANLINLVNEAAILFEECEKMSEEYEKSEHVPEHRKNLQLSGSDKMQDIEKFTADISEMLERINIGELNVGNKEETFQTNSNEGCSAVAIHEVGHAMVSLLSGLEPFEKITIISRGDALGYVSPSTKNPLRTKRDFLTQIRICLGGRVAEELFYGEDISTGAVQDIQQATIYAEKMITLFGMSDVIGPMTIKTHTKNYLGNTGDYGCSDAFRFEVDNAIKDLLSEQMSITRNMLETHKEDIEKMAQYIFDCETATGEEFKDKYQKLPKNQ